MMFLQLLLAHLLGDFVLQPATWVKDKEEKKIRSPWLYVHCLVHGMLTWLMLAQWQSWPIALLVMGIHFVIDVLKLLAQTPTTKTPWFIADQLLHVLSLVVLYVLYQQPDLTWLTTNKPAILLVCTAILFLSYGCAIVVQQLMAPWTIYTQKAPNDSLAKAGKYIGMLERLFVFLFVLVDHWEGIGFLIAAHSVFRFSDLKESKDRKLTEYILIGTMLSFGLAVVTALITTYGLRHFAN